jgi:HAD superfamily phosphoserine phosphatase-like hydrolase
MAIQDSPQASRDRHYLIASDFDKTLSFNDSGIVLSEMMQISGFEEKVEELARLNLVQQGGELAYLLLHDPPFRGVRKEHLAAAGKKIHLKQNIRLLSELLDRSIDGHRFSFYVISAAPEEVIQSALEGIVPADHIFGTRFEYDKDTGQIKSIAQVSAGYGKVAALDNIQSRLHVSDDRVIYTGDGSSDVHVMLHVNRRDGYTIAVSEAKHISEIAMRTVISDDALSIVIPILEDICHWDAGRIRGFFESQNLMIQEWGKVKTDWLTIRQTSDSSPADSAPRG